MTAPAHQPALFDEYGQPAKCAEPSPASAARRPAPLAANADPVTSHIAARRVQSSKRQSCLTARVFSYVAACAAPETFHEIGRGVREEAHAVMKTLNRLRHAEQVEHAPKRICSVTGSLCVGWRVASGNTMPRSSVSAPSATRLKPAPPKQREPIAVQPPASNPPSCGLCKGKGIIRTSSNPPNYAWCDEVRDRRCLFAEALRRLNPDPNYFGFAGEAA